MSKAKSKYNVLIDELELKGLTIRNLLGCFVVVNNDNSLVVYQNGDKSTTITICKGDYREVVEYDKVVSSITICKGDYREVVEYDKVVSSIDKLLN